MSLIQVEETALATSGSNTNSNSNIISYNKVTHKGVPDLSSFENCVISFVKPTARNTSAKPLLFPSTNGFSFRNGFLWYGFDHQTVLRLLTGGLPSPRWGNSRKGEHCTARAGAVAACVNGHAGAGVSRNTAAFNSRILLGIRNPFTAFPASVHEKLRLHHGATGQVTENEWRDWRNSWLNITIDEWTTKIRNWETMSYYTIGTYVPYEHWLDPDRGPAVIQRIADILRQAGFSVAPPQDIPCIWYHSIKDKYVADIEFFKYVPGYTVEQRDYVLAKLQMFMEEMADESVLLPILKEYYADVQNNTRIDNLTPGF
jgi:hypothetical protein